MATRQVIIDVPEKVLLTEKTDEIGFSREMRVLAAVKLYELGRLSSGIAAELAAMSRVEFLLNLNRYRVFPFASELAELEGSHAGLST
jgi:predicted HTH domain antitoxin